jgi:coenzyme F420-0:L-glutamate ligase / coenzyme F420-1:gamma-L-glutamate ligase
MGILAGTLELSVTALTGLPEVVPGADLAGLLSAALERQGLVPRRHDILVVTQKIVSKAEGRYLDLQALEPSQRAEALARITGKDAHLVEAVLSQADEVLRAKRNVLIVATHQGLVIANGGIDQSNLTPEDRGQRVLLLPEDADRSADRLRERLHAHFQCDLGLIISDSAGRAWRLGTVGIAIGAAGVPALLDRRGEPDRAGRPLEVSEVAFADAVAAMAVLAMGEAAEARPAALVRGLSWSAPARPAGALVRPKQHDMFR